jgi:vacuolar protein sorting-associated protein 26
MYSSPPPSYFLFPVGMHRTILDYTLYFFRYHLKDVIVGKIYFLLVRIKIKHMELQVIKRETTGTGTL